MFNGSLDADAMVFLAQHADRLNEIDYCNDLVATMTEWLEGQRDWGEYFVFKGKRLDRGDGGLAYVARYYVMLARTEAKLWAMKTEPLPDPLDIASFWKPEDLEGETENNEYIQIKAILNAYINDFDDYEFAEGNTAVDLARNCAFSRIYLKFYLQELKAEVGCPSFLAYEMEVKAYLEKARVALEEARLELDQRTKTLCARLQYDSIQREMESLEN